MRKWLFRLGALLFFFGMLNFSIHWEIAVAIGGDALSGKTEDGQFYICSHGDYTEVSHKTYSFSYVHSITTYICFVLGIVGLLIMWAIKPKMLENAPDPSRRDYLVMAVGGTLGIMLGASLVILVPILLESKGMRTPWSAIPWFAIMGAIIAVLSYKIAEEKLD